MPGMRHLNATGGLLGGGGPAYDLVRVGLAFYGVLPPELDVPPGLAAHAASLRPAISLRARAAAIAAVPAGAAVGYGGTWTAARPSVVATVALGYADGWARAYAAGSWGVARGRRVTGHRPGEQRRDRPRRDRRARGSDRTTRSSCSVTSRRR